MLRVVTLLVALAAVVAAPAARAAAPVTAAEAIAALNAQRARNGLPAGITENPAWSEGCRLHMAYQALNGYGANPHDEDPALPGYTVAGRDAARSSVLTSHGYDTLRRDETGTLVNPFENAPIHLAQMLGPRLSVTGYSDGCMYTWPGYNRPAPPTSQMLSYPGDGGSVTPSMTANESPFVPGDLVGLPLGTVTGPHLYVFAFGPAYGRLSDVSLTGPDGPVEVRTVDNYTSGPLSTPGSFGNIAGLIPPGGIIIAVQPLRPLAQYSARATFTPVGAGPLVRQWSFTTTAVPQPPPPPPGPPGKPPKMEFTDTMFVFSTGVAGHLTVVDRDTGRVEVDKRFAGGGSSSGTIDGGEYGATYRACFRVDPPIPEVPSPPCIEASYPGWRLPQRPWNPPVHGNGGGAPTSEQASIPSPTGAPRDAAAGAQAPGVKLTLSRSRGRVRAVIRPGLAGGQRAQVSVQRLRRACARCALKAHGKARVSTVRLNAGTKTTVLTLGPAPARVRINVAGFQRAGVNYRAAAVVRTVR